MSVPSRTARRVAERRAAHQLLDTPVVLCDPLALRIVGATRPAERARLTATEHGRLARTLRAFMAARARVAEDELASAVAERSLRQYVILGAGLDTFAYRNPFADRVRVFEVDQPGTQTWKREQLADAGITAGAVVYVPVDFESQDPFGALRDAGWDAGKPTLFAWLGVTMYLEPATVMRVLQGMALLASGTQVVFDYAISPELLGPIERLVFDEFAKRVAAAGEPWVSWFDPRQLQQALYDAGFARVDDLGPDDLNGRYFCDRADGMRVGTLAHIISATV